MAIFNSYVSHYQRVDSRWIFLLWMVYFLLFLSKMGIPKMATKMRGLCWFDHLKYTQRIAEIDPLCHEEAPYTTGMDTYSSSWKQLFLVQSSLHQLQLRFIPVMKLILIYIIYTVYTS